jgi:hypothetical protein
MRVRFCFVLLAALIAATAMGQDQPKEPNPFLRLLGNGVWWTNLNADAKNNFVDGYTTAMAKVNRTAYAFCKRLVNTSGRSVC